MATTRCSTARSATATKRISLCLPANSPGKTSTPGTGSITTTTGHSTVSLPGVQMVPPNVRLPGMQRVTTYLSVAYFACMYFVQRAICLAGVTLVSSLSILGLQSCESTPLPIQATSTSRSVRTSTRETGSNIYSVFAVVSSTTRPSTVRVLTPSRQRNLPYATVHPITISHHSSSTPALATLVPSTAVGKESKQAPQKNLITLAAILFVVSGALAAAETAITTLWPWKVRELAEKEGSKSPFSTLEKDLTKFLTTILVSTTSTTIFSTAIATDLASDFFGPSSVPYVTVILTIIFLFLGEILPKSLAVHAPTKVARIMVPVISFISIIVYPVGKLLAWMSTHILRLLKLPMESDSNVSEEELRLIVAGADRSGTIEKYESQIIHNVLDLEDMDVSEVMCPRVDMVAVEVDNTLAELIELEKDFHYSRMPVFESTVDNIVGVAMTKSLLKYVSPSSSKNIAHTLEQTKVLDIMDPAFFVPESMSVWVALEEMRKRRLHMAVVVDEYGGTAGLVTLEDILEEVVGEIYDEDDDYEADKTQMKKGINGELYIEGQTELQKVGDTLKLNLPEDDLHDYGTISGFLCAKMGGIPELQDYLIFKTVRFTIEEADDRRVLKVKAEMLSSEEVEQIRVFNNLNNGDGVTDSLTDGDDDDDEHSDIIINGNAIDDGNVHLNAIYNGNDSGSTAPPENEVVYVGNDDVEFLPGDAAPASLRDNMGSNSSKRSRTSSDSSSSSGSGSASSSVIGAGSESRPSSQLGTAKQANEQKNNASDMNNNNNDSSSTNGKDGDGKSEQAADR